jgi:hypothetical protein
VFVEPEAATVFGSKAAEQAPKAGASVFLVFGVKNRADVLPISIRDRTSVARRNAQQEPCDNDR